jgi:hypothetical protein
MTSTTSVKPFHVRYAWLLQSILAALMALSALFIVVNGVDSADFVASTGIDWPQFQQSDPEIAAYITRLERLAGAGGLSLAAFGLVIGLTALRHRQRSGWISFWVLPLSYLLITAIMLLHQSPIAYFYLGIALIQTLLQLFTYSNLQARST